METLLNFYSTARLGSAPINVIFYNILLAGCCGYALWRGGAPERIGTTILAVASFLTLAVLSVPAARYRSVEIPVLIVDLACMVAFLALALRAERFWPLWMAALQIIGTAGHAVRFVDPDIVRRAYAFILAIWSYPMIFLLVAGIWRHQQRLARFGADRSWSNWKR